MPTLPESKYSKQWEPTQTRRFDLILGTDPSTLLRESSTEFNFLEVKDKLTNIRDQVSTIAQTYDFWAELPDSKRNNLNSSLDDMITQFGSMQQFDPKQNNPWEIKNNIVENFNNRYNSFYEFVVVPLNGYLGRKAYSRELSSRLGQEAKKELEEIRRIKREIENVQVDVKDAAAVAGDIASAAHSASFGVQAGEHKGAAKQWLWGVFAVMTATLLITLTVVVDIIHELSDKNFAMSVEASLIKIAIIAFLYIVIRFNVKNYSAHQHLYIINKQRANVLQSMEAFRSSATSDSTKDAVLLAAIGSAFTQQETGFITTKEGAGSDDSDIMKVVETALKR